MSRGQTRLGERADAEGEESAGRCPSEKARRKREQMQERQGPEKERADARRQGPEKERADARRQGPEKAPHDSRQTQVQRLSSKS